MMYLQLADLATDLETELPAAGGKAQTLARLLAGGFPTPPGWVILPDAFAGEGLTTAARQAIASTIAARRDRQPGVAFAVRSSGLGEDSATAAFAGVFQTVLNVATPEAVLTAIEAVYASRHQATAYRRAHGLDPQQTMAVIVQELIRAKCAGVCLTVDPVAQWPDSLVINAAWGLGAGVMDGRIPSDTYWLHVPEFTLAKQHVVTKTSQLSPADGRIVETDVPSGQQRLPCLPPAWHERIAQFALALTRHFGQPQEVEWAIADDRLWILQSRPQTALPAELERAHVSPFPVSWEKGSQQDFWRLMEYSQGETPPLLLEHDTVLVRESIREETCRVMGVDKNREMRVWNGRGYARHLPLNLTPSDYRVRRAATADLRQRLQQQGQTTWDYWGPEIVSAVRRLRQFDRDKADGAALADHLEESLAVLRRHLSLHPRIAIGPPDSYFAAFTAVCGLADEEAKTAAYHLLDSEESMLTRLVDGLYSLAVAARQHSAVAALVAQPPTDVMDQLAALPEATDFRQQLDVFLEIYGERTGDGYGSEVSIRTPTWLEDPARPLRLVATFLDPDVPAPDAVRSRARAERAERVEAVCATCADETAVADFQKELTYARQSMVVLEEHNHWIDQATAGRLRLAVMAAARWLVAQGVLREPDEVFWLTYAEISNAVRTGVLEANLVATRQAEYADWATLPPPPFLGMPAATLPPRPVMTAVAEDTRGDEPEGHLSGLGASPGRTQGRVRILPKGAVQVNLQPGDILVAVNAGPLWTPFFPILGGLILEEGSLGQHAATTAREYGIPAIINVRRATHHLADGERVTMDGVTGVVTRATHLDQSD